MKGVVFLTGEAPELALAELEGAIKAIGWRSGIEVFDGRTAILGEVPPPGLASRLGFSHFSGALHGVAGGDLEQIIGPVRSVLGEVKEGASVSWTVKARRSETGPSPKDIFEAVGREARRAGCRVSHRTPDVMLFIILGVNAYVGRVIEASSRDSAVSRRGSKMPFNRPVIMDPRLARVLVNLSGLPPGSTILDPFLGPAGLAIEAADLGLRVVGVEKDPAISSGARENVEHLGLSDMIEVICADSRDIGSVPGVRRAGPFDGIVTDPPFGRSAATHGIGTGDLLRAVLAEVSGLIRKGAPLVVDGPSPEHVRDIPGYLPKVFLSYRVHKSLTRYIAVLEKE